MYKKITVVNIINHFEIGGAEILLTDFAKQCNDEQIRLILIFLKGTGTLLRDYHGNAKVINLSKKGKFTSLSFFRLVSILHSNKVDILHTHDPQSGILGRIAAFIAGVKIIITTRHNPELKGNHNLVYRIEDWFLKKTDLIIAISEAVKTRLIKNGLVDPKKIAVIYNGVNFTHFLSKNNYPVFRYGKVLIGSVGRLHEQKGFDILLNAIKIIKEKYPELDIKLKIAGEGEKKNEIIQLIENLSLQESVMLVGAINDREEIRKFYENIDIFILASKWEGFGISIVEALAMKKPVVVSNVDGIVEIVEDGYNGLLFESQNKHDLAEKIINLINNRSLMSSLSQNARTSVEVKFSMETYAKEILQVYKNMISNKGI